MIADDLKETLVTCRQALGDDVHPIWVARIGVIWLIVQWAIREQPQHWQATLDRAERAVDLAQRERGR